MDKQIDRIIMRQNPELMGEYHLPMFARVETISDPIVQSEIGEAFRPRYAVDLRVLDENDQPDMLFPIFKSVPLPAFCAGLERGVFGFPEPGAIVELAFAYGLPNKPFIRTLLTTGQSLPLLKPHELLLQSSPGVSQRADSDGNWSRDTFAKIVDSALHHRIENYSTEINTQIHNVNVGKHSTEEVSGIKTIEALGALKLLSGGVTHLSAVEDLHILTAANQKNKVANDFIQRVGNIADSLAQVKQIIKVKNGGSMWLGNEAENLLQLVSELIQVVMDIAETAKNHTHTYTDNGKPLITQKPDQSGDFAGEKSTAGSIKNRLDPIIER